MKNIVCFFLLVCQLNSAVLLPQTGPLSCFSVNENQFIATHSFRDFLNAELNVTRHTAPVSDNEDQACEGDTDKYEDYYFHPLFLVIKVNSVKVSDDIYKHFSQHPPSAVPFDINTPPPKA